MPWRQKAPEQQVFRGSLQGLTKSLTGLVATISGGLRSEGLNLGLPILDLVWYTLGVYTLGLWGSTLWVGTLWGSTLWGLQSGNLVAYALGV